VGERRFKVKVGQVDRPEKGVRRDNRVEQNIHTGKGGDKDGGGDRRLETVAAGGASHTPVDVRVVRAGRTGEEERRGGPFFASDRVIVGRGGGSEMDGAEGAGSFNELY
jgi:hypothetical protein